MGSGDVTVVRVICSTEAFTRGGPVSGLTDLGLRHADSPEGALGKVFALAGDADVAAVWVGGEQVASGGFVRPVGPRVRAGNAAARRRRADESIGRRSATRVCSGAPRASR